MVGVGWSVLWSALVAGATIVEFHVWRPVGRFRAMCVTFLAGMAGYALSFPVESAAVLLNGLYFYAFWFVGILCQVYGLADRGFSLAILTDAWAARAPVSRKDLRLVYAGGQGMAFAREKRLRQLLEGRFIVAEASGYRNTRLGRWIGRVFRLLRGLYGFEGTG